MKSGVMNEKRYNWGIGYWGIGIITSCTDILHLIKVSLNYDSWRHYDRFHLIMILQLSEEYLYGRKHCAKTTRLSDIGGLMGIHHDPDR